MDEKDIPRATDHISLQRVDNEIWLEFYQPGLRFRIEMTQKDIDSFVSVATQLAEDLRTYTASQDSKATTNPNG